ncbi:sugar ABC transporter permease [Paenibacillus sp. OV219]|uniref:ABC transporter permease n=1 Tax=Paenibacillus sp. OV219 TaxID=1884377 RepID=UPI0008B6D318|nr:ABC transporter permease subunit [Paenibacillus sp. OV219]SEO96872.1 putative aldouronate transport system permease protein [Paenibacillus sp. OV219]
MEIAKEYKAATKARAIRSKPTFLQSLRSLVKHWQLSLMLLPVVAAFLIFSYFPLLWLLIAFKDYNIGKGLWGSPWVGWKHFHMIFTYPDMLQLIRNTVFISLLNLGFGFPAAILFALMLNEIKHSAFKRTVQTLTYLPYFIPWTIMAGFILLLFSVDGLINNVLVDYFGLDPKNFLTNNTSFIQLLIGSAIWKGMGWSSIIYLAAIAGVNPQLYEAAHIDGASRLQRIVSITIPSIAPVIGITFILQVGGLMSSNFDQIYNMYNAQVYKVADVIDTFVVRMGVTQMQYSITTAMGLFKGVVGFILIILSNYIIRKTSDSENSLW